MSDYNRENDRYSRDDNRGFRGGDRDGGFRGGDRRDGGFRGERRSYGDRSDNQGGERRPYGERRFDDRNGGFGERRSYGGDRGGYGQRRDFGGRPGGDRQPRNKWEQNEVEKLQELVKQHQEQNNGKVDWEAIGKELNGRYGSSCFNKYTQISEKEWTAEEEEVLGKWWEENNQATNDITAVLEKLEGHTKRGAQFKLERLTQEGKYNPTYRMGKEEMQRCE